MAAEVGICRCEKVRTRAALSGRDAHNARRRAVVNADPTRSSLNENLRPDLPADPLAAFDQVHEELGHPKLRKNGVLAIEYVVTYSPTAAARIDAHEWAAKCLHFVEDRHGRTNVLSAFLHLDEKTPHVHVLAVPAFAGAIVVGPYMGSRGALRRLQDDFHKQVSSCFGLARTGDNPTGRAHILPAKLRAASEAQTAELKLAIHDLETAANVPAINIEPEPVSVTVMVTSAGRQAYADRLAAKAAQQVKEATATILSNARSIIVRWHEQHRDLLIFHQELRAMKSNQAAILRDIDLRIVAESILGFAGRPEGPSTVWDCDSHKLVITGCKFKDFKQDQHGLGGGAIDLVMFLLSCDCAHALRVLAGLKPDDVRGAARVHFMQRANHEAEAALQEPYRLSFTELLQRHAAPIAAKLHIVRQYLHQARCLSLSAIDQLIVAGDLWANRHGSCVFAHRNAKGDITGCTVRASVGDFRQCLGDKTNSWFRIGSPFGTAKRLILTESPIDTLSYAELNPLAPDVAVISTAGQTCADPLVAFGHPLLLSQDNDRSGEEQAAAFATAAQGAHLRAQRLLPTIGKDWNEYLIQKIHEQRRTESLLRGANQTIAGTTRLGDPKACRDLGGIHCISGSDLPKDAHQLHH
jgi:hypothetical protein